MAARLVCRSALTTFCLTFAAGGLGILLGDGALNYRPEKVLESYYSYSLNKWSSLTFDYQFVGDPGYNQTDARDKQPGRTA